MSRAIGRLGGAGALATLLLHAAPAGADGGTWQNWTAQEQATFYTTDQGSRIIPMAWFQALDKADGSGRFAADGLARFGYIQQAKPAGSPFALPVGFLVAKDAAAVYGQRENLSMTCAACHTREIRVAGKAVRIDGGPALADFHGFLTELDAAVRAILLTGGDFDSFAKRVLGAGHGPAAAARLKTDVVDWYANYGWFMKAALPDRSWGPARLDAFGMIFNRVSGLDLDIPDNVHKADAPVRYPFLWNASRQDMTQWTGTVPNGLFTLAIGRNLGEVYGVFGRFAPARNRLGWVNFVGAANSAKFHNLMTLEKLVSKLTPPPYPLPIDQALATRGQAIFVSAKCDSCHGARTGALPRTWATQATAERTDPRMFDNARGTVGAVGALDGVSMPQGLLFGRLSAGAARMEVLKAAVGNTLLQEFAVPGWPPNGVREAVLTDLGDLARPAAGGANFVQDKVQSLYKTPNPADRGGAAYEARVLQGIWAAAPYLHNGSVPNLWELLQKPENRKTRFMVGSPQFDPVNVGLATDTSPTGFTYAVSSCAPPDNGNGNCGHAWGTDLTDDEKWALIEYLKTPRAGLDNPGDDGGG